MSEHMSEHMNVTSATDLLTAYAAGQRDFHGANLSGANLSGADLSGAHLSGAHLSGAHLSGAHLSGADLRGADLSRADLSGANLSGADLRGADLRWADLSGADLREADLSGADLSGAHLSGAHLSGAHLSGADLTAIRADVWRVLESAPAEVPALLLALEAGQVDGLVYYGECPCLVGTLAAARGCEVSELDADSASLAERWALAISAGTTPSTSQVSAITAEWVRAWLAEHPAPPSLEVTA